MSILRVKNLDGTWAEIPAIVGAKGESGKDGYTPVKGVDYWTSADQKAIVDDVSSQLLVDSKLPDYWITNLNTKIPSINTAMETAGKNKSAFYFYTDAHRISSANNTAKLLKYLYKHTSIQKTNSGGDFFEPFATGADNLALMRDYMADMREISNHHSVIGNHDEDNEALTSNEQLYGFYHAWEENNDVVWGGYHYYYIDNKAESTRYIYLDTGKFTISNAEMQFVIDALNTTPEDWHIIAISHIWYDYEISALPDYVLNLLAVFDAYNGRIAGSVTHNGNTFEYDFVEALGNVEFCIGGHVHSDEVYYSNGGIPIIITDADSTAKKGSAATLGTITEGCIDAVIADYNARKVKLVRIGRGSDRNITIPVYKPDGPEEIVNILDVYDIQYNKRYSTTGKNYKDANGVIAFAIPWSEVWEGKTIYFKGFSHITGGSTSAQWIIVKDSLSAVNGLKGSNNYDIFTCPNLQNDNGVYSITIDRSTIGDYANYADADRLQIQMLLNTGTAVSAADLANCIMTINQPIE